MNKALETPLAFATSDSRKHLQLKFIGFQEDGEGGKFRLWNIFNSPMPHLHPDGSTVGEETLKEMEVTK